jgi:hypothetical protein
MATHKLTGDSLSRRKRNYPIPADLEVVTKGTIEEALVWNPFFPGALTEQAAHLNNGRAWEIMPGQGVTEKVEDNE